MSSALHDTAVCPMCRADLVWDVHVARCRACGAAYEIHDGMPVLRPRDVENEPSKAAQLAYYAGVADEDEYEITRPRGTPPLHQWFLAEKSRRALSALPVRTLTTALVVCGGSGLDAEWLTRSGLKTVCTDISIDATERAAERARRFGLGYETAAADVERLPFPDRSFDLVLVHDGLHHLDRPAVGLAEMARVARHAVSVTEPAAAAVTRLAVRLGVAERVEDAGNEVARLTENAVADALESAGYVVAASERYAMFYRHHAGPVARAFSAPGLCAAARGGWGALNAVAGRFGNKLVVQGVRPQSHADTALVA